MATIQQIDANRRNSQLSTGPVTPEGKQHVALNALKSGIYAESTVIPGEDPTALLALTGEYYFHHRPVTPEARALVDSLIHQEWLLRRLRTSEAALYNCDCAQCDTRYQDTSDAATISLRMFYELKKFDFLQRRINATERNYHRSLKALQSLESQPELASFPQEVLSEPQLPLSAVSALQPQPDPRPEPQQSKPTSEKLASFPQEVLSETQLPPSAVSALEPQPAPHPEPEQSKPASEKLASFPQEVLGETQRPLSTVSVVEHQLDPRPEPQQSKPTSAKLASFPQPDRQVPGSLLLAPCSPNPEGISAAKPTPLIESLR